jgi:hypothetical protein
VGATGEIVRADPAFYSRKVLWAARRAGARFSVTARADAKVQAACDAVPNDAWVDIKYPQAIWDEDEQRWISNAQIAETNLHRLRRHPAGDHRAADRAPRQTPRHPPDPGPG